MELEKHLGTILLLTDSGKINRQMLRLWENQNFILLILSNTKENNSNFTVEKPG